MGVVLQAKGVLSAFVRLAWAWYCKQTEYFLRLLDSLNVGSSPEGYWPGPKSQEVSGDGWRRAREGVGGWGSESEKNQT